MIREYGNAQGSAAGKEQIYADKTDYFSGKGDGNDLPCLISVYTT